MGALQIQSTPRASARCETHWIARWRAGRLNDARRNIDWYHRKRRTARLRGPRRPPARGNIPVTDIQITPLTDSEPEAVELCPRCGASVGLADSWQHYRVCPTCRLHAQWPARA